MDSALPAGAAEGASVATSRNKAKDDMKIEITVFHSLQMSCGKM